MDFQSEVDFPKDGKFDGAINYILFVTAKERQEELGDVKTTQTSYGYFAKIGKG